MKGLNGGSLRNGCSTFINHARPRTGSGHRKQVDAERFALLAPTVTAGARRLMHYQVSGTSPPSSGAKRDIAAELRSEYVTHPKGSVSALPGRFGGLNNTVMVPTDHAVRPGDAIYVLERFF